MKEEKLYAKSLNFKEFCRLLNNNGFECTRNKGDHYIYKRGNRTITINRNPNQMVMQRLIKENNLT